MKALTLTQPWATLVTIGEKQIETRSWSTNYRGPLAIHAAKGFPLGAQELCLKAPFYTALGEPIRPLMNGRQILLPRGVVLATCQLIDCLPIAAEPIRDHHCIAPDDEGFIRVWHPTELGGVHGHYSDLATEHEHAFGDYTPGRFGFVLKDIQPLAEPVPARGSLGLWDWNP